MNDFLFEYAPTIDALSPGQWRLSKIEIYNWGTLQGLHSFAVPRKGLLITGESGSGKSTILDALTTMMVPDARAQFNAAASGGESGDKARTRLSYVRGAYAREVDTSSNEARIVYLRPHATKSGIALTFSNGQGKFWTGMRIFHASSGAVSNNDLTQGFFSFKREQGLREVIERVKNGNFISTIKAEFKDAVNSENSRTFNASLLREVGIGSSIAANLLHKTLATKNVNSLDQLMREYMLEEPETFKHAESAVQQFTNLKTAHEDVVKARQQIELLQPLRGYSEQHQKASQDVQRAEELLKLLPLYRATLTLRRAQEDQRRLEDAGGALQSRARQLGDEKATLGQDLEQLNLQFLDAGGQAISSVDKEIEAAQRDLQRVNDTREHFAQWLTDLSVERVPESIQEFQELTLQAQKTIDGIDSRIPEQQENRDQLLTLSSAHEVKRQQILRELESLKTRESALPAYLVDVRHELSAALGIPESRLPFAAELIQVNMPKWRGAAERLLRPLAVSLLVGEGDAQKVAEWVNGRRLTDHLGRGVDLTYRRIPERSAESPAPASSDSIINYLSVKDHPLKSWLVNELHERFDYVCVDSPSQLRQHAKALTAQGLIRTKGVHRKNDRRRVDDRSDWILGWDNGERFEDLLAQYKSVDEQKESIREEQKKIEKRIQKLREVQQNVQRVMEYQWEQLDSAPLADRVDDLKRRKEDLEAHDDILGTINAQIISKKQRLTEVDAELQDVGREQGKNESDLEHARQAAQEALETIGENSLAADDEKELRTVCLGKHRSINSVTPNQAWDIGNEVLTSRQRKASDTLSSMSRKMAEIQVEYITQWPQFSTNLTKEAHDIPDFLDRLQQLEVDNLPKFEEHFKNLLQDQTQQGITALSSAMNSYFPRVSKRIEPVNNSLSQTPYNHERRTYLKLEATHSPSVDTKQFLAELKAITANQFGIDAESSAAAEQRFARIERVMMKLSSQDRATVNWRREVLDTRRHVTFRALERDEAGVAVDVYESSQGRSGGQSQKLVTFALAAALRYQLADLGTYIPRYGTVMLDEAFDKTDAEYARASLEIFKSFGFQLIMASPMKMIQTVEPYVAGVIQTRMSSANITEVHSFSYESVDEAGK